MSRLRAWRNHGHQQLAGWAELGRREQADSRTLALDALTVLRENMLARVSESPDVKSAIREQSQGIAVTAVGELRERSARADDRAEQTVGRFKTLVTTPNSDVLYAMSYVDLGKDGPLVFEAPPHLQGILLDFWQRPIPVDGGKYFR
jgi:hypothetical protein